MMIKSLLLLCVVAVTRAAGVLAPVGYGVGHVGVYGAPYGAPYSVPYGSPYGAPYGSPYGAYGYGAWNPYSAYPAQPAYASQSANILHSPFNIGQISTYTKAIDTPFSTVRKADVRVSNPGLAVAPAYSGIATPLVSHATLAPVTKVATAGGLLGVTYSAAPAVSHMTYSSGLGYNYAW